MRTQWTVLLNVWDDDYDTVVFVVNRMWFGTQPQWTDGGAANVLLFMWPI